MSDLRKAAQALVDRWDTPLWKDAPHTGEFIDALRAALAQPEQDQIETMTVDELKASLKRGEKWRVVELEQEPIGESGRFERLLREYKR